MNNTITINVVGIPKGQPRPRAFVRGGRAAVYDPGTAEAWKSAVALACAELQGKRMAGAIDVELGFYMPRPKSHYRANGEYKDSAPIYHTSKPDADNLAKAVLDAMTAIGVWIDDSQVRGLSIARNWENPCRSAGCEITITQL